MIRQLKRSVRMIMAAGILGMLVTAPKAQAQGTSPDSVRVKTLGNVAPVMTSNVVLAQGPTSLQLNAAVYPLTGSQRTGWSILAGGTASATIDTNGLLTVPAQVSGIVWAKATLVANPALSDSIRIQVYCKPNNTNAVNWFIFDTVRIAGTTLNNPSSGLGTVNAYRFFPEGPGTTAQLTTGRTYTLQSHVSYASAPVGAGYSYSYSMWIDYNRNGIFDTNEWTEVAADTSDGYTARPFMVPATAIPGKTMMRVRMRLAGGANGATSACTGNVGSGQMQDYIVNLLPGAPLCTTGDPAATPGSLGCVSFTYKGSSVTYTTVRAKDGNIWLQQNMGSPAPATAATDSAAYGDTFQWGRWDDGHQERNSVIRSAPVPNDPSGVVAGTAAFYSGSTNWWAGGSLTDTWTAGTPAAVSSNDGCDPCKAMGAGWHLPSQAEWTAILASESMTSPALAFSSNLKMALAGYRSTTGAFDFVGVRGYYWSSTTSSTGGKYLYYSTAIMNPSAGGSRGQGASIRCLKTPIIAVDSIRVRTSGGVSPVITTNGGTLQMASTIYPATANQNVTWSIIPATGSAAINATGLVTAQTNGTVWAKAISVLDVSKMDSMMVTISNQIVRIDSIRVRTSGGVSPVITTNGGTLQMASTIYPATANQNVTWSIIPATGSATINAAGLVTAQTNGTIWAKAISVQDITKMDSIQVTITNQMALVDSVRAGTQSNVAAVITARAGTLQMVARVYPATANQNVIWSIVPVTGSAAINAAGLVTAQTNGTVWAKAISVQDISKKDSVLITISNQSSGIAQTVNNVALQTYPNPVTHSLTLAVAAHHPALQIVLTDVYGKVISKIAIPANGLNTPYLLNMEQLASGVYFIRLTGDGIQQTTRVIRR